MTYRTPDHRRRPLRDALTRLQAAGRVVLTTHLNADGDGAGSEVAMAAWLRASGTQAWIINPTPFPSAFEFLLPEDGWVVAAGHDRARELCDSADLAVVLDTGEVPRIGRVKPLIEGLPTVVIDHHPPGSRPIGGTSVRDDTACATGELVYDLVSAARGPWPEATIRGIYVAILTDTGSFRFNNATPACHRVVAELIEAGADPEALHREVYGASPVRRLRLLRASLETLEVDADGRVAWMTVPRSAYRELGATPEDLEGLVDYPRSVEGVEVGILFRSTTQGDTKVSFRSNGPVDVNELARSFGGGGHVRASGARIARPPSESVDEVVEAAREAVVRTLGKVSAGGNRQGGAS
jgi:phosphoesterase RecJ-like protein